MNSYTFWKLRFNQFHFHFSVLSFGRTTTSWPKKKKQRTAWDMVADMRTTTTHWQRRAHRAVGLFILRTQTIEWTKWKQTTVTQNGGDKKYFYFLLLFFIRNFLAKRVRISDDIIICLMNDWLLYIHNQLMCVLFYWNRSPNGVLQQRRLLLLIFFFFFLFKCRTFITDLSSGLFFSILIPFLFGLAFYSARHIKHFTVQTDVDDDDLWNR